MSVTDALDWAQGLMGHLSERERTIARQLLKEIVSRLGFLVDVGLDYLTVDRTSSALGRRGAADPPRHPDRVEPGGRAVHPGRADDRAAPEGQRQAHS